MWQTVRGQVAGACAFHSFKKGALHRAGSKLKSKLRLIRDAAAVKSTLPKGNLDQHLPNLERDLWEADFAGEAMESPHFNLEVPGALVLRVSRTFWDAAMLVMQQFCSDSDLPFDRRR